MTSLRTVLLSISLCTLSIPPARGADDSSGKGALPPDLAAVPADAIGFAHVRLADLWKSDALKDVRDIIGKAGEEALKAFDQRFVPAPSTLERLTAFALRHSRPEIGEPLPIVMVTLAKAFDREQFLKNSIPGAEQINIKDAEFYIDPSTKIGFRFLGDRIIALGPPIAIAEWLRRDNPADGALRPGLELAASGKPIVAAINVRMLPIGELGQVPPPIRPLFKAHLATLTLDLAGDGRVELSLVYSDAQSADAAEKAVRAAAEMAREALAKGRAEVMKMALGDGKPAPLSDLPTGALGLLSLGAWQQFDDFLKGLPLKHEEKALVISVHVPRAGNMTVMYAASIGLLLPAVQKVREAAARAQSQNNLKQIGLAMHNFAAAGNGTFPPAAICDKKAKPLLSWRVAVLPYIEQEPLYKQFKLDEPWDSDHNKKLIPLMPKTYALPAAPLQPGITHYRCFVGNGAAFDWIQGARLPADFTDGTSNTWLVVEAGEGVPWTKPDELEYDPQKPLPKFGTFHNGGFNALFGDGSVRFFLATLNEKCVRAFITRAGGEANCFDE
jgi:prepilin-type processing-associated H-X9-DG protein